MNKKKPNLVELILSTICFCLLMSFLTACASKGTTQTHKEPSVDLTDYKRLAINVTPDDSVSSEIQGYLEGVIIGKLRDTNKFERVFSSVLSPKEDYDLKLNVQIKNVREVSGNARFFAGALAGQGNIVADIEVIDGKSKNILASATVEGETSGGSSWAGTTEQAVKRMAEEIVDFLIGS